jgi:hypothetical protein
VRRWRWREHLTDRIASESLATIDFSYWGKYLSLDFFKRSFTAFVLSALFAFSAGAQQTTPSTAPPADAQEPSPDATAPQLSSSQQTKEEPKDKGPIGVIVPDKDKNKNAGTSNDRLFYALPNFLTLESTKNVPPLTTAQKYKVVARGSFDYIQIPWYGFLSGLSQAQNSEPGYGQGAQGYGKRFASAFADGTIENFMTSAVFSSLLHQDPRFFQSGRGSFTRRTGYAVSRIFVTRTDSGGQQFNYSEVLGSALSAAISTNTYHPRAFITKRYDPGTGMLIYVHNQSDRTLTNTLSVWGSQVGYDTITIVVKEFWPDIHRKISHKHKDDAATAGEMKH